MPSDITGNYPRKHLYVASEEDLQPTFQHWELSESKSLTAEIRYRMTPTGGFPAARSEWWTGNTVLSIVPMTAEDLKLAAAARKGRPARSKTDAKCEAKQSRLKALRPSSMNPFPR